MESKVCTKCLIEKPVAMFNKNKRLKYGVTSVCKECRKLYLKNWNSINKDKISEYVKKWRVQNIDKHKKYQYLWNAQKQKTAIGKEYCAIANKNYRSNNLVKCKGFVNTYGRESIMTIAPVYIKKLLLRKGIDYDKVSEEVKNHFKEIIQLKRELKNEQLRNKI